MSFSLGRFRSARALGGALLGSGLAAGLVLSGAVAPSFAQDPAPVTTSRTVTAVSTESDPAPDDRAGQAPAIQLVVSSTTPLLKTTVDSYEFGVVLRNTSDAAFTAGDVSLRLAPQRVEDQTEFDGEFPSESTEIASVSVGETAAESEQELTLRVGREDFPLRAASDEGVYRLEAAFTADNGDEPAGDTEASAPAGNASANDTDASNTDASAADASAADDATGESAGGNDAEPATDPAGDLSAQTAIVWRGAGKQQLPLSVIVPFVLPADAGSMPTRKLLESLAPEWQRLLDQAALQQATLAIDPRIIAGIRAYGAAAPESAREFLAELETTPLQNFLLQFGDADPAAQAALGLEELLQPVGLEYLTRYGEFPVVDPDADPEAATAPDTEPNTTEPTAPTPTAPTLAEMLSWPNGLAASWPAAGEVDADTLDLVREAGLDTVVLSSNNAAQTGGPRATLGDSTALIADATLAADAATALRATTDTERQAATADIATRSALAAQLGAVGSDAARSDHKDRKAKRAASDLTGMILAIDRGGIADAADPADPAALLEELRALPWLSFVPTSEQRSGTATLVPGATSEARAELLQSAVNREESVTAMNSVLAQPEYLSGYQRSRLLAFFGTRYASDQAGFIAAAQTFRERDAELLKGVEVVSTESTQLVGATTKLPLQVHNSLPFDALIDVQVDPASAAVSVKERRFTNVLVPAEGNEHVMVPVHARVSSGSSGIIVTLTSVHDDLTAFTGTISLSINTSIETIAVWTLGVLAALLLVFGIIRSVRRRRRRAAKIAAAASDADAPTAD